MTAKADEIEVKEWDSPTTVKKNPPAEEAVSKTKETTEEPQKQQSKNTTWISKVTKTAIENAANKHRLSSNVSTPNTARFHEILLNQVYGEQHNLSSDLIEQIQKLNKNSSILSPTRLEKMDEITPSSLKDVLKKIQKDPETDVFKKMYKKKAKKPRGLSRPKDLDDEQFSRLRTENYPFTVPNYYTSNTELLNSAVHVNTNKPKTPKRKQSKFFISYPGVDGQQQLTLPSVSKTKSKKKKGKLNERPEWRN